MKRIQIITGLFSLFATAAIAQIGGVSGGAATGGSPAGNIGGAATGGGSSAGVMGSSSALGTVTNSSPNTAAGSTAGTVSPIPSAPVQSVDTEMGPTPSSGIDSSRFTGTATTSANPGATTLSTTSAPINPSSANIINIQQKLTDSGFDSGSADGVLGTRTQSALQAYQRAQGLPATGVIDNATMSSMGLAQPQSTPGAPTTSTNSSGTGAAAR